MKTKGIIILVVIIIALGVGAYFVYQYLTREEATQPTQPTVESRLLVPSGLSKEVTSLDARHILNVNKNPLQALKNLNLEI